MRSARILLVEPEDEARRDLDRHLERAGHEVASVPDEDGARRLLEDGLEPDVVVADSIPAGSGDESLRRLAPRAAHLRILATTPVSPEDHAVPEDPTVCSRDPDEVVRRVEEVLLGAGPRPRTEAALGCLDLVRRLASVLPSLRSTDARCDAVTEAFDSYFGVTGSLVVRRDARTGQWVEAAQGIEWSLVQSISAELQRRTRSRGLRPFLTRVLHEGRTHEIAGLAIQGGGEETDLALVLGNPPDSPALRESLVSLVGSALRAAMASDDLESTHSLLEARTRSLTSLHEMSHAFTRVGSRKLLGEEILRATQRELQTTRSALFLRRDENDTMLASLATRGLPPLALDRIGLSAQHGVGAQCFAQRGVLRLAMLEADGVAAREMQRLRDAGLQWAIALRAEERALGVLFFGNREEVDELDARESQALESLAEAASGSLRSLQRTESLRDVALSATWGLVAALELRRPEDKGHAQRVARSAVTLGRSLGLGPRELRDLAVAGLLHDVGKLAVEADPGLPGESDPRKQRMHPVLGARILSRSKPSPGVLQGVEQHHERFDGRGFPYGLRGDNIHLFGRILAVADAQDRWGLEGGEGTPESTRRRLELAAGLLFDPALVALHGAEAGRIPPSEAPPGDDWFEEVLAAP